MIRNIRLYPEFNSKGEESLRVKIQTEKGVYSASVPSGTSRGSHEAVELPVEKVLRFFSKVRPHFIGRNENELDIIDGLLIELDGTGNFSKLGENLSLGISIAAARAATDNHLWKLTGNRLVATFPIPVANVIGGGMHGGGTEWQEFLVIPYKAQSPLEAVQMILDIWKHIGSDLGKKGLLMGRNIENAWMSRMNDLKTLDYLSGIAEDWDVKIGVDFAASSMWNSRVYDYERWGVKLKSSEHMEIVKEAVREYGIYYVEDPVHENAFRQCALITRDIGKESVVVGDDLYTTNPKRVKKGIRYKSTNAVLVKPNQIGTLTQTHDVVVMAKKAGLFIVPSHRSGETYDNWLADLAVAWDAPLIKAGTTGADAPKLNRLIELWEEIPSVRMAKLPKGRL